MCKTFNTKVQRIKGSKKNRRIFFEPLILRTFVLLFFIASTARAQTPEMPMPAGLNPANLPLTQAQREELAALLKRQEYTAAEKLLVAEIDKETARAPKSPAAASLLAFAGGVFFLNGEFLNAAVAYQKSKAIAPLEARSRFTMSMAFIRLKRPDWARPELEKLVAEFPKEALYLYWLARMDYDAQQYQPAVEKLRKVIELAPQMTRAYDNLGLCFDYLGQYDEAVKHFAVAIELNRKQTTPSPWPPLNLGITLQAQNKLAEAESALQEALRYDNRLPQIHYQMGLLLEKQNRGKEAIASLERAAEFDATYADPHYALGRLYQKQGDSAKAKEAIARFQQLKDARGPGK